MIVTLAIHAVFFWVLSLTMHAKVVPPKDVPAQTLPLTK